MRTSTLRYGCRVDGRAARRGGTNGSLNVVFLDPAADPETITRERLNAEDPELAVDRDHLGAVIRMISRDQQCGGYTLAHNGRLIAMKEEAFATKIMSHRFRNASGVAANEERPVDDDTDPAAPVTMGRWFPGRSVLQEDVNGMQRHSPSLCI